MNQRLLRLIVASIQRSGVKILTGVTIGVNLPSYTCKVGTSLPLPNEDLARISHHPPAADADKRVVPGRTPAGRLDVVSTTPAPTSGPCTPPQRLLDALATDRGEKCGLDMTRKTKNRRLFAMNP